MGELTAAPGGPAPRADTYALLADGRCVHVRSVTPADWQVVHDFTETLGPDSLYRRFFSVPSDPGSRLADLVCAPNPPDRPAGHGALLAVLDGSAVGLAEWYRAGASAVNEAEIAFAVSDRLQGKGVATLLAEHLMLAAERAGIRRLVALTQGENRMMLGVFVALGVPVEREWDGGDVILTIDLDLDSAARAELADAAARRERVADEASLRALTDPAAIAVLGDRAEPATALLLENLAGFARPVYRVTPEDLAAPGLPASFTAAGLTASADGLAAAAPGPSAPSPDLALVTLPPAEAVGAARRCAEWGIKVLIVTAGGFERGEGRSLLHVCHQAGMRLVGPGSLGVANPRGPGGFSALLTATPPQPGGAGVAVQSGGVGLALLSHLSRLGIGVSGFAAVGEKYDVSATDLLLLWEQDPDTRFGLLHVESFGNPRKFAHTARRVSRRIPLLAVDPEQSPSQARTALYAQAGIIAVPSLGALVNAATLAAHQPAPGGRRVAVLGNTHGMVTLAAQACLKAGLDVVRATDLTPKVDADKLAAAVTRFAHPSIETPDAVLIALAPIAPAGPPLDHAADAILDTITLLAVHVDQPESVAVRRVGHRKPRTVPVFNDAAAAAAAFAALVRAGEAARRPEEYAPLPEGADLVAARGLIERWMARDPEGGELAADEGAALLATMGVEFAQASPGGNVASARVTAWQDPVFGPLLSFSAAEYDRAAARTLLAPASPRELHDQTARVAPDRADELADLVARMAVLVDRCPEVASMEVTAMIGRLGPRVRTSSVALAPAQASNPYLRRLRRAPVE